MCREAKQSRSGGKSPAPAGTGRAPTVGTAGARGSTWNRLCVKTQPLLETLTPLTPDSPRTLRGGHDHLSGETEAQPGQPGLARSRFPPAHTSGVRSGRLSNRARHPKADSTEGTVRLGQLEVLAGGAQVHSLGLSQQQEGAQPQAADGSHQVEHGRPGARGLDEVAPQAHAHDTCSRRGQTGRVLRGRPEGSAEERSWWWGSRTGGQGQPERQKLNSGVQAARPREGRHQRVSEGQRPHGLPRKMTLTGPSAPPRGNKPHHCHPDTQPQEPWASRI